MKPFEAVHLVKTPGRAAAAAAQNRKVELEARLSAVAKVSHTLEIELAERLREFAFRERISESAVVEYALYRFFLSGKDSSLGTSLRESGAGKRRRS